MAACCDGYSSSALMGNWFEHRHSIKQPAKMNPEEKILRKDDDIKFISDTNEVKDLSKISRIPKWNTQHVILDYGKREYTPLATESFRKTLNDNYFKFGDLRPLKKSASVAPIAERKEENMQTQGSKKFRIIDHKQNPHELFTKRKYPMNVTDFYSTLKNHDETHNKLFAMTTYQESFQRTNGATKAMSYSQSTRDFRSKPAGLAERVKLEGTKISSLLVGETYRDYEDPQQNTHIQRAWVHGKDRTLDVAEKNLRRTTSCLGGMATREEIMSTHAKSIYPQFKIGDGINSLPLENGIRQFHPHMNQPGAYRKIRSNITRTLNKPWGYK